MQIGIFGYTGDIATTQMDYDTVWCWIQQHAFLKEDGQLVCSAQIRNRLCGRGITESYLGLLP